MEKVMQYIWQWRLYGDSDKHLTDGRPVRIIHPGLLNTGSGPDFFNAKIAIDGTVWAGNVELHMSAADWHRHGHDADAAYDSVILHVVGENDGYVRRRDGSIIPQLHLPFSEELARRYSVLASSASPLRCKAYVADVPALFMHDAIDSAAMERLQQKAERVIDALNFTTGDWSHTCVITIARALGGALNSEPLERLARVLSPSVSARHSDSCFQLEALWLGSAGLLDKFHDRDEYASSLWTEWGFLRHKYGLAGMEPHIWKFAGMRPAVSPLRILVYLAHVSRHCNVLFSRILEAKGDVDRLVGLFAVNYDGYWAQRLTFGDAGSRDYSVAVGVSQVRTLLINAVAPLYYAYGQYTDREEFMEIARELWIQLPPEDNSVIRMWGRTAGFAPADAWESQGLLQLTRRYCEPGNCLSCRIALQALRRSAVTRC